MGDLSNMIKKINIKNLVSHLTYNTVLHDTALKEKAMENNEKQIEESYNWFFSELENLYTKADRNDDKLFDLVTQFAMLHDDIYFEVGLLVGFQLYKNMEQGYHENAKNFLDITTETQVD